MAHCSQQLAIGEASSGGIIPNGARLVGATGCFNDIKTRAAALDERQVDKLCISHHVLWSILLCYPYILPMPEATPCPIRKTGSVTESNALENSTFRTNDTRQNGRPGPGHVGKMVRDTGSKCSGRSNLSDTLGSSSCTTTQHPTRTNSKPLHTLY